MYPENLQDLVDGVFGPNMYGPHVRAKAMELAKDAYVFGVRNALYIHRGHGFGLPRPERKGMDHTAPSYRVCIKCGRSDVSLLSEAENGQMPPCK